LTNTSSRFTSSQLRSWRDIERGTQQSRCLAPCQSGGYVKKRAEMLREVKCRVCGTPSLRISSILNALAPPSFEAVELESPWSRIYSVITLFRMGLRYCVYDPVLSGGSFKSSFAAPIVIGRTVSMIPVQPVSRAKKRKTPRNSTWLTAARSSQVNNEKMAEQTFSQNRCTGLKACCRNRLEIRRPTRWRVSRCFQLFSAANLFWISCNLSSRSSCSEAVCCRLQV